MSARLRWLQAHAPLDVPVEGCAWLPPAPGCETPAWVCVSRWSSYGSASGTFGANAIFGTDPAQYAELSRADLAARIPVPGLAEPPWSAEAGTIFALEAGEETLGRGIYDSCLRSFELDHPCEGACWDRLRAGDPAAWPGREAAEARCEAEAAAAAGSSAADCELLLVDACTGHIGVDCPDRRPRYSTPAFVPWGPPTE